MNVVNRINKIHFIYIPSDAGSNKPIRQESLPDLCRMVIKLKNKNIKFISCGSIAWFAYDHNNKKLHSFGDADSGICGVGRWRGAQGRTVQKKRNN